MRESTHNVYWIRRAVVALACCLLWAPALGCDDEPEFPDREISGNGDAGNQDDQDAETEPEDTADQTGDTDESDPDTGDEQDGGDEQDAEQTDDTDLEPIDTNREDTAGPGVSGECLNVQDLGTLALGTQDLSFQLDTSTDGISTSCRDLDAPTRAEKIYQFQVDALGILELDGGSDLTFELRGDPCGEEASVESCNPNGTLSTNVSPGIDYFLVIEPQSEISTDTINFDFVIKSPASECGPGQTRCETTTQVEVCGPLGNYTVESCATSCSGDSCVGDSCQNPIEVNGNASMSGELSGFSDKLRLYPECTSQSASNSMEGSEVVFLAEGLANGQTINVDASADTIQNTIFILRNSCGANGSCEAYEISGGQTLNFSVQRPGDYYVIIDSASTTAGAANYTVTVN